MGGSQRRLQFTPAELASLRKTDAVQSRGLETAIDNGRRSRRAGGHSSTLPAGSSRCAVRIEAFVTATGETTKHVFYSPFFAAAVSAEGRANRVSLGLSA